MLRTTSRVSVPDMIELSTAMNAAELACFTEVEEASRSDVNEIGD
jgi:hypothetical protein